MNGTVNISQFTEYLRSEGLIIVSKEDYEIRKGIKQMRFKDLQRKLLQKDYLTIKDVVVGKLLPVTTRQSVNNWIDKGVFTVDEVFINKDGKICIATCAILRVRKRKNFEI